MAERKCIMKKATARRTAYGYQYQDKCIVKKSYAMYNVVWWVVDDKKFNTLKAAKEYIDTLTSAK